MISSVILIRNCRNVCSLSICIVCILDEEPDEHDGHHTSALSVIHLDTLHDTAQWCVWVCECGKLKDTF